MDRKSEPRTANPGAAGFTVGDREDQTGFGWPGEIAEVVLWDHALSQQEIDTLETYAYTRYAF
jgi:hypothetical protein